MLDLVDDDRVLLRHAAVEHAGPVRTGGGRGRGRRVRGAACHTAEPIEKRVLLQRGLLRAREAHVLAALRLVERRLRARAVVVEEAPRVAAQTTRQ